MAGGAKKKKKGKTAKVVATSMAGGEAIQVACRVRPLNQTEIKRGDGLCIQLNKAENTVRCGRENDLQHTFPFDQVFGKTASNEEVYEDLCAPIVESVLDGINGSIMAYGQTGSGKTYTMFGGEEDGNEGIVPRVIRQLFGTIAECPKSEYAFDVRMSVLEIYQNKIYDLIGCNKRQCVIKTQKKTVLRGVDTLTVQGATEVVAKASESAMTVLLAAQKRRTEAETKMNKRSSRSHCVVVLSVAKQDLGQQQTKFAQLYLVDLAGSENASKTGAGGERLEEAKEINKSLTTLGRVIDSLIKKASHIPYRDSNLTRLLQNSLGGNARCALCVNVSPSEWNYGESLSTLYFGCRTRAIKNKPKSNQYLSVSQLQGVLTSFNNVIQKNDKMLTSLDNSLNDMGEFFDVVRNSGLGSSMLLCSNLTSMLEFKRISPNLLVGCGDGGGGVKDSSMTMMVVEEVE